MSEYRTTIKDELLSGRSVTYFTVGTSMQPLLFERETHVMLSAPSAVRKDDILLFIRPNGQYVLHRLIKRDADIYYMRGDNTYELEPVSRECIIGVVTHIYRRGKTFCVKENAAYLTYAVLWRVSYPLRYLYRRLRTLMSRIWHIFKKGF